MTIRLSELRCDWSDAPQHPSEVVYRVDLGERHYDVFIRSHDLVRQPGMEAVVPMALLAAMSLRRPLHVEGRLSATFLNGVRQVMALFAQHFEPFDVVDITADELYQAEAAMPGERRGAFFSGGVDSFYTLFKGREELTDLIYIHGFDVRLDDWPRRQAIANMGEAVAASMGMRFVQVESNLAKVLEDFGSWPLHGHGFALMSVARALAGAFGEIRVPGTHSLKGQKPWGSWLDTDPLFSDERLSVVHDACEAERVDKIIALADQPLALRYLRVCWGRVEGTYNCCRCEKCLRTMTTLHALGKLQEAEAFPLALTPALVANVLLPRDGLRCYAQENIALLQQHRPEERELIAALEKQWRRPIWLSLRLIKWRKRLQRWRNQATRLRAWLRGAR